MNIQLNIDDLIDELNLPTNTADTIVEQCVNEVTQSIYESWKKEASDKLKSTRTDYIEGLDIVTTSRFARQIVLKGALNQMIEKGAAPYDMKEHFKKSSKVKYAPVYNSETGETDFRWYLTIPFRIGTPGIVGENSAFSNIMPKSIHKIMKSKPANEGLKSAETPSPYDIPQSRAAIQIPSKNIDIPEYKHKSGMFEGMVKKVGAYGKTTQNTYMTFRRVGEASDPNSWIHSGIKAYNLLGGAMGRTDVNTIVENKVDEVLENLGY
jgi:spermidine/putrescine-binding protein